MTRKERGCVIVKMKYFYVFFNLVAISSSLPISTNDTALSLTSYGNTYKNETVQKVVYDEHNNKIVIICKTEVYLRNESDDASKEPKTIGLIEHLEHGDQISVPLTGGSNLTITKAVENNTTQNWKHGIFTKDIILKNSHTENGNSEISSTNGESHSAVTTNVEDKNSKIQNRFGIRNMLNKFTHISFPTFRRDSNTSDSKTEIRNNAQIDTSEETHLKSSLSMKTNDSTLLSVKTNMQTQNSNNVEKITESILTDTITENAEDNLKGHEKIKSRFEIGFDNVLGKLKHIGSSLRIGSKTESETILKDNMGLKLSETKNLENNNKRQKTARTDSEEQYHVDSLSSAKAAHNGKSGYTLNHLNIEEEIDHLASASNRVSTYHTVSETVGKHAYTHPKFGGTFEQFGSVGSTVTKSFESNSESKVLENKHGIIVETSAATADNEEALGIEKVQKGTGITSSKIVDTNVRVHEDVTNIDTTALTKNKEEIEELTSTVVNHKKHPENAEMSSVVNVREDEQTTVTNNQTESAESNTATKINDGLTSGVANLEDGTGLVETVSTVGENDMNVDQIAITKNNEELSSAVSNIDDSSNIGESVSVGDLTITKNNEENVNTSSAVANLEKSTGIVQTVSTVGENDMNVDQIAITKNNEELSSAVSNIDENSNIAETISIGDVTITKNNEEAFSALNTNVRDQILVTKNNEEISLGAANFEENTDIGDTFSNGDTNVREQETNVAQITQNNEETGEAFLGEANPEEETEYGETFAASNIVNTNVRIRQKNINKITVAKNNEELTANVKNVEEGTGITNDQKMGRNIIHTNVIGHNKFEMKNMINGDKVSLDFPALKSSISKTTMGSHDEESSYLKSGTSSFVRTTSEQENEFDTSAMKTGSTKLIINTKLSTNIGDSSKDLILEERRYGSLDSDSKPIITQETGSKFTHNHGESKTTAVSANKTTITKLSLKNTEVKMGVTSEKINSLSNSQIYSDSDFQNQNISSKNGLNTSTTVEIERYEVEPILFEQNNAEKLVSASQTSTVVHKHSKIENGSEKKLQIDGINTQIIEESSMRITKTTEENEPLIGSESKSVEVLVTNGLRDDVGSIGLQTKISSAAATMRSQSGSTVSENMGTTILKETRASKLQTNVGIQNSAIINTGIVKYTNGEDKASITTKINKTEKGDTKSALLEEQDKKSNIFGFGSIFNKLKQVAFPSIKNGVHTPISSTTIENNLNSSAASKQETDHSLLSIHKTMIENKGFSVPSLNGGSKSVGTTTITEHVGKIAEGTILKEENQGNKNHFDSVLSRFKSIGFPSLKNRSENVSQTIMNKNYEDTESSGRISQVYGINRYITANTDSQEQHNSFPSLKQTKETTITSTKNFGENTNTGITQESGSTTLHTNSGQFNLPTIVKTTIINSGEDTRGTKHTVEDSKLEEFGGMFAGSNTYRTIYKNIGLQTQFDAGPKFTHFEFPSSNGERKSTVTKTTITKHFGDNSEQLGVETQSGRSKYNTFHTGVRTTNRFDTEKSRGLSKFNLVDTEIGNKGSGTKTTVHKNIWRGGQSSLLSTNNKVADSETQYGSKFKQDDVSSNENIAKILDDKILINSSDNSINSDTINDLGNSKIITTIMTSDNKNISGTVSHIQHQNNHESSTSSIRGTNTIITKNIVNQEYDEETPILVKTSNEGTVSQTSGGLHRHSKVQNSNENGFQIDGLNKPAVIGSSKEEITETTFKKTEAVDESGNEFSGTNQTISDDENSSKIVTVNKTEAFLENASTDVAKNIKFAQYGNTGNRIIIGLTSPSEKSAVSETVMKHVGQNMESIRLLESIRNQTITKQYTTLESEKEMANVNSINSKIEAIKSNVNNTSIKNSTDDIEVAVVEQRPSRFGIGSVLSNLKQINFPSVISGISTVTSENVLENNDNKSSAINRDTSLKQTEERLKKTINTSQNILEQKNKFTKFSEPSLKAVIINTVGDHVEASVLKKENEFGRGRGLIKFKQLNSETRTHNHDITTNLKQKIDLQSISSSNMEHTNSLGELVLRSSAQTKINKNLGDDIEEAGLKHESDTFSSTDVLSKDHKKSETSSKNGYEESNVDQSGLRDTKILITKTTLKDTNNTSSADSHISDTQVTSSEKYNGSQNGKIAISKTMEGIELTSEGTHLEKRVRTENGSNKFRTIFTNIVRQNGRRTDNEQNVAKVSESHETGRKSDDIKFESATGMENSNIHDSSSSLNKTRISKTTITNSILSGSRTTLSISSENSSVIADKNINSSSDSHISHTQLTSSGKYNESQNGNISISKNMEGIELIRERTHLGKSENGRKIDDEKNFAQISGSQVTGIISDDIKFETATDVENGNIHDSSSSLNNASISKTTNTNSVEGYDSSGRNTLSISSDNTAVITDENINSSSNSHTSHTQLASSEKFNGSQNAKIAISKNMEAIELITGGTHFENGVNGRRTDHVQNVTHVSESQVTGIKSDDIKLESATDVENGNIHDSSSSLNKTRISNSVEGYDRIVSGGRNTLSIPSKNSAVITDTNINSSSNRHISHTQLASSEKYNGSQNGKISISKNMEAIELITHLEKDVNGRRADNVQNVAEVSESHVTGIKSDDIKFESATDMENGNIHNSASSSLNKTRISKTTNTNSVEGYDRILSGDRNTLSMSSENTAVITDENINSSSNSLISHTQLTTSGKYNGSLNSSIAISKNMEEIKLTTGGVHLENVLNGRRTDNVENVVNVSESHVTGIKSDVIKFETATGVENGNIHDSSSSLNKTRISKTSNTNSVEGYDRIQSVSRNTHSISSENTAVITDENINSSSNSHISQTQLASSEKHNESQNGKIAISKNMEEIELISGGTHLEKGVNGRRTDNVAQVSESQVIGRKSDDIKFESATDMENNNSSSLNKITISKTTNTNSVEGYDRILSGDKISTSKNTDVIAEAVISSNMEDKTTKIIDNKESLLDENGNDSRLGFLETNPEKLQISPTLEEENKNDVTKKSEHNEKDDIKLFTSRLTLETEAESKVINAGTQLFESSILKGETTTAGQNAISGSKIFQTSSDVKDSGKFVDVSSRPSIPIKDWGLSGGIHISSSADSNIQHEHVEKIDVTKTKIINENAVDTTSLSGTILVQKTGQLPSIGEIVNKNTVADGNLVKAGLGDLNSQKNNKNFLNVTKSGSIVDQSISNHVITKSETQTVSNSFISTKTSSDTQNVANSNIGNTNIVKTQELINSEDSLAKLNIKLAHIDSAGSKMVDETMTSNRKDLTKNTKDEITNTQVSTNTFAQAILNNMMLFTSKENLKAEATTEAMIPIESKLSETKESNCNCKEGTNGNQDHIHIILNHNSHQTGDAIQKKVIIIKNTPTVQDNSGIKVSSNTLPDLLATLLGDLPLTSSGSTSKSQIQETIIIPDTHVPPCATTTGSEKGIVSTTDADSDRKRNADTKLSNANIYSGKSGTYVRASNGFVIFKETTEPFEGKNGLVTSHREVIISPNSDSKLMKFISKLYPGNDGRQISLMPNFEIIKQEAIKNPVADTTSNLSIHLNAPSPDIDISSQDTRLPYPYMGQMNHEITSFTNSLKHLVNAEIDRIGHKFVNSFKKHPDFPTFNSNGDHTQDRVNSYILKPIHTEETTGTANGTNITTTEKSFDKIEDSTNFTETSTPINFTELTDIITTSNADTITNFQTPIPTGFVQTHSLTYVDGSSNIGESTIVRETNLNEHTNTNLDAFMEEPGHLDVIATTIGEKSAHGLQSAISSSDVSDFMISVPKTLTSETQPSDTLDEPSNKPSSMKDSGEITNEQFTSELNAQTDIYNPFTTQLLPYIHSVNTPEPQFIEQYSPNTQFGVPNSQLGFMGLGGSVFGSNNNEQKNVNFDNFGPSLMPMDLGGSVFASNNNEQKNVNFENFGPNLMPMDLGGSVFASNNNEQKNVNFDNFGPNLMPFGHSPNINSDMLDSERKHAEPHHTFLPFEFVSIGGIDSSESMGETDFSSEEVD